jgi:hypothetical protein
MKTPQAHQEMQSADFLLEEYKLLNERFHSLRNEGLKSS